MKDAAAFERDYLEQMKKLALQATAGLDCSVFLFGSRARGDHRRGSDIDIGFEGLREADFLMARDRLLGELEESVIPHRVDLVNLDAVSGDFRNVAMRRVVIWKNSSNKN